MRKIIYVLAACFLAATLLPTCALGQHEHDLHFGNDNGTLAIKRPPNFEVPKIMNDAGPVYVRDQGVDFYVPSGWTHYELSQMRMQQDYITPGLTGGSYFGGSNPGYLDLDSSGPHIHMAFATTSPGTYFFEFHLTNGLDWWGVPVADSGKITMIWVADSNYAEVDLFHIRNMPDTPSGSPGNGFAGVEVNGLVVSSGNAFYDGFYAQTSDRSAGIYIESTQSVSAGDVIDVQGTLKTSGGERIIDADSVTISSGNAPEPMFMPTRSLAAGAPGKHSPATYEGAGLSPTGMLVKLAGVVRYDTWGDAYLDDGSILPDYGNEKPGIRIDTYKLSSPITLPADGTFTTIVGIAATEKTFSGDVVPILRPRGQMDINP